MRGLQHYIHWGLLIYVKALYEVVLAIFALFIICLSAPLLLHAFAILLHFAFVRADKMRTPHQRYLTFAGSTTAIILMVHDGPSVYSAARLL